jgi:hypothetical protein
MEKARDALQRLGIADFSSKYPREVGPGIAKRTAIARALMLDPKCLVLDEPTTGLDSEAAGQVNQTIAFIPLGGPKLALFGMPQRDKKSGSRCEQEQNYEGREMYHHVTFLLWLTFVQEWMKEETVMHDHNIRVFVPTNSAQRGRIGQG